MNNVVKKFKKGRNIQLNKSSGIRKMQTASGGPITYEEDWSDRWEPYAAKIGLAGDAVGLGAAATGVGIPVASAVAAASNVPNLVIDGYQTIRDFWRSYKDKGASLGSAAWNGGELILDAAGLKILSNINKAAKAGVTPKKILTLVEKDLVDKPWKRVGTGVGRIAALNRRKAKLAFNKKRNVALRESTDVLAKKGVRESLGEYFREKLADEMAKRGYGVAVNDAIKSANRTLRQNLGVISGVSGGTNLYHIFKKEKGGLIRKMQTAAGGPIRRIRFTPEQIAEIEKKLNYVPGTNNSTNYKLQGEQALDYLESEQVRKLLEILSRSEMKPTLKKKATTKEKIQGKKDLYVQTPLVIGMSGSDALLGPVVDLTVGTKGLNAIGKTILWNTAKYAPKTLLGNWGRGYFVNKEMKLLNPFKESVKLGITLKAITPKPNDGSKTSLKFFERKPSRLTESERAGVPKVKRNNQVHGQPIKHKADYRDNSILGSYTYKDPSGVGSTNFLKEFFNRQKIQGLEYTVGGLKLSSKNVLIGLPENIRTYLNENTVERNVRAMRKAGYSEREIQMYKDKVNEEMLNVRVGLYSGLDYKAANSEDFGGFFNDSGNFISVNKDAHLKDSKFTPDYVMKHEGRHLIDHRTGMTNELYEKLEKAYDKDFLDIPNHEDAGALKGYLHMADERVTTNRDSRDVLLSSKGKYLLNEHDFIIDSSKRGYSADMIDFLNKIIKYALPEDIVNAVENSNGYGKRYIKYLREHNKLTPEKIEQFREAMMYVPSYLLPIAGGYTLYNLFNQPLQQLQYLKQGGKMNKIRKMLTAAGGPINYKRWDDAKITSYTIPFIKEKAIKLTNAGRATGAVLSTNLLDSIANNAIQAGVPVRTAIGLATKESTLGNPTDDKSAWNLSSKIRKLFNGVYPGTAQHINNGTNLVDGIKLINYHKGDINHEMFNGAQGKSIIQEGLEFYKTHPDKYNPGLKGYQKAVDSRGEEVMNSPEVLKWYREWERSKAQIFKPEPYKINTNIQNTAQEFVSRNKQGGKMNIIEFLKKGSGIHIKKKNRGKFTSYCGGKVTDECIRKAKASGNPTLVKRATFAANARKWKHLEGGQIKIPKNRTLVRTIKINNGILTAERDSNDNLHWFRNGKYITPNLIKTYKFYDPLLKAYRLLTNYYNEYVDRKTVGTKVYTPNLNIIRAKALKADRQKMLNNINQSVPFNGEKITLRTKGKMNLADIPTNLLDSIAINSGRSNTDFFTNSALVGKESTFGGFSKALGNPIPKEHKEQPWHITNNTAYFNNDYSAYNNAFENNRKPGDKVLLRDEANAKYALEHGLIEGKVPLYSNYVLADAFKRYSLNPSGYNPGQSNYALMVNGIKQELMEEKQFLNYWNTRGKEFYNKGKKETMKKGGIIKAQFGTDLNVDNLSDTTRKGYGKLPYFGAANNSNTAGLFDLLNYNVTKNPNVITGAPEILPGRVEMLEKEAPTIYNMIVEHGKNIKDGYRGIWNGTSYKNLYDTLRDFFKTGDKNILTLLENWAKENKDTFVRRSISESIPKGFTKGNEVTTVGKETASEAGLSIRDTKLGNMNNPPTNPSEKIAVEDWNKMNPDNRISSKLPTGKPLYELELGGLKIDIRYPKKITPQKKSTPSILKSKTNYALSGTAHERFIEGKKNGISKKGRVSSNDRNARAMEASDARITNSGFTGVKRGQLSQVEKNLEHYPEFEKKLFNKKLLNMYRNNRPESEIRKAKNDFYRYLAERYGYFKKGGILKAEDGTKVNTFLKIGNFFTSDSGKGLLNFGSSLVTGGLLLNNLSKGKLEYFESEDKNVITKGNEAYKNANVDNEVLQYMSWINSLGDNGGDIVRNYISEKLKNNIRFNAMSEAKAEAEENKKKFMNLYNEASNEIYNNAIKSAFDFASTFANSKNGAPSNDNT